MTSIARVACTLSLLLLYMTGYGQLKTTYDYDQTVDFSLYKTFRFTEDAKSYAIQELNRNRMLEAIRTQLQAKGLTESEEADLDVNWYIRASEQERATSTSNYYGAGGRYGYRWGGGFSTSTIDVESYIVGTVFIDLVDTESNSLVWQGRGEGTYQESISPEKRSKRINKGVAKIFKKYPPEAK